MTTSLIQYEAIHGYISEVELSGDSRSETDKGEIPYVGRTDEDSNQNNKIHIELSGSEFNRIYHGINFYKFMNNDLKHFDFTYKIGLNIDTLPFNPVGRCEKGGLYFCEESNCFLFWKHYGQKMTLITIPDDARVYIDEDKFKSDKIIIERILNFNEISDDFWINIFRKDPRALQFIKNQTEELCKEAVKRYGMYLSYIDNPTEEVCRLAVKQDGLALQFVKKQTDEICALAVQQTGQALSYVKNQTEGICKLAVAKYGYGLEHVKVQTEEICKLAVSQNSYALKFVNNEFKTPEVGRLAIKQNYCVEQYMYF